MISLENSIKIDKIFESAKDWIDIYTYDNVASTHRAYDIINENLFQDAYELAEYCFDKISTFCKEKKDRTFTLEVSSNELEGEMTNIFFNKITFYITKYDRKTMGNASYSSMLIDLKDIEKKENTKKKEDIIVSTWNDEQNVIENVVIFLTYDGGFNLMGDLLHELKHAYKDYKIKSSGGKGIRISKNKINSLFIKYNKSHRNNPLTDKDYRLFYNFIDPEEADAYVSSVIGDLKKQKFKSHREAFDWLYKNSNSWNMCIHLLKKVHNTLNKIEDEEHGQIHEYLAKLADKIWSKFISKVYSYVDRHNVEIRAKMHESFAHQAAWYVLKREKRCLTFTKQAKL